MEIEVKRKKKKDNEGKQNSILLKSFLSPFPCYTCSFFAAIITGSITTLIHPPLSQVHRIVLVYICTAGGGASSINGIESSSGDERTQGRVFFHSQTVFIKKNQKQT